MYGMICKYSRTFNGTTDWTVNGANSEITILGTEHCKGIFPVTVVEDLVGGDYVRINTPTITTDPATGDVTISIVTASAFDGRVIIF